MSAVSRVSIPNNMKKTIQNIKEITGKHSDDEIYAMLKECSMDPNETVQKLLFQDTFHEVKRKRDRRKEGNKEATAINWRQEPQGRMGRAPRGNYSSRYTSNDFGAGRNMTTGKENQIVQARNKEDIASSFTLSDTAYKGLSAEKRPAAYTSRSMDELPNGLIKAEHLSADHPIFSGGLSVEETAAEFKKSGVFSVQKNILASSAGHESSISTASSGVNTSESESVPVPVPSLHASIPDSVGTVAQEGGIYLSAGEAKPDSVSSRAVGGSQLSVFNDTFEKNRSFVNGRVHGNSLENEGTRVPDTFQSAPSTVISCTSGSRPSSTYSNRSQHASGPLKAGPTMEWKPKSTNVHPSVSSKVRATSFVDEGEARGAIFFSHTSDSTISDTSTKILNLEDMQISDSQQQVIIPDHLQVPESERTCLTFGSFGSNFGLDMGLKVEPEKTKCPEEPSELSGELEEIVDQLPSYGRDETPVAHENIYSDDQQPEMPENHLSSVTDISSSISTAADYDESKEESADRSQHSVIHAAPVYSNFGLMPQMVSSPFSNFQGTDMHAPEATRLPGFVVPQPFDPSTNYYASMYRPTADGDGRFSPFLLQGTAPKYNGSIAILPHHIDQSQQENGNSMVLSSAGPTIVTQTTVVQQTAAAVSPQTVPIFRQPAGVHISHYPPNYNPYNQYYSAFYVPSPAAIPHFLGNPAVYPQQPPTGSLYPPSTAPTGTTSLKYPISQYKPATNSGPTGQGTYGMHPAGYSSAPGGGNSNGSEDLSSSIFKENYVFFTPPQNGAAGVWVSPPGRDISTLPAAGSFYNVPLQGHGQPVAFAHAQAAHGAAYGGVYHPSQPVAAAPLHPLLQQSHAVMGGPSEMIGRPVTVYQQSQQCAPQINWADNF